MAGPYCTLKPHLPGIGITEPLLAQVWKIVGGLARESKVFLGVSEYVEVIGELLEETGGVDREGCPLRKEFPRSLEMQRNPYPHVLVICAPTDDRAEVARLNRETPGAYEFQQRLEKLRTS